MSTSQETYRFKLFPEAQRWFSFQDYAAVLSVMARLKPARVLEFGPGSSTLALVEGGAAIIHTCEDKPDWAGVYETRLQGRFPGIVRVVRYVWTDPLTIPGVDDQVYDLALIDGPHGTPLRPKAIAYAMARCAAVLAPTEDYKTDGPGLRPIIRDLAAKAQRSVEMWDTGPTSGGFALIGAPC